MISIITALVTAFAGSFQSSSLACILCVLWIEILLQLHAHLFA